MINLCGISFDAFPSTSLSVPIFLNGKWLNKRQLILYYTHKLKQKIDNNKKKRQRRLRKHKKHILVFVGVLKLDCPLLHARFFSLDCILRTSALQMNDPIMLLLSLCRCSPIYHQVLLLIWRHTVPFLLREIAPSSKQSMTFLMISTFTHVMLLSGVTRSSLCVASRAQLNLLSTNLVVVPSSPPPLPFITQYTL